MQLVLGTRIAKRGIELAELLAPWGFELITLADLPESIEVEETGETFAANAAPKRANKRNICIAGCWAKIAAWPSVFQDATLLPWASTTDNVWLPLRLRGVTREAAREDVTAVLHRVGLTGFETARPAQLSDGMRDAGVAIRNRQSRLT